MNIPTEASSPTDGDFCRSSWPLLVANIDDIYKSFSQKHGHVPPRVRLGCPVNLQDNPPKDISNAEPFMFDWCSFRGICFRSGDIDDVGRDAPMKAVRQIAGSMLLRLMLESGQENFIVHKVDFEGMGRDFDILPTQPKAPVIVDRNDLNSLLQKLRGQIANNPMPANTWRCDSNANSYAADSTPIQVVLIADWENLYDVRDGIYEQSDIQKLILGMLKTDMSARNGIYFVICTDWYDSKILSDVLPIITESSFSHGGFCARFSTSIAPERPGTTFDYSKNYDVRHEILTDEQIQIIQKGLSNFISGTLTDTDGDGIWLGNSAQGLRAVMGITTQGENQFFELGVGQAFDAFHALIGGATGSGKSVLLREIICSLAERYSPRELRMLLLDYKEGTEFAPFTKLPHVYALSIGSNPEFGLEVLKETLKEIERRGQLFKEAGNAKNIEEYRRNTGEVLCRYVLVADEFQVLLNDKKYGEEAKKVLNDLVRRGRAFGFNAILATQTLRDGALDGEAKNQFACRIAMKMAESETDYFLGADNTVPSTFNRKGQALLNYALGRKDANILFQSGNKEMPKKFRDTDDVLRCLNLLHDKAVAENCLPTDVYVYNSDGYAEMPDDAPAPESGLLIGLRNNMMSTPVYIAPRQLTGKVLVVGGSEQKRTALLASMTQQLSAIYGTEVSVQTPADYLDYGSSPQVTVIHAPEGDFDLEDAIAEWREAAEQVAVEATPQAIPAAAQMSGFVAPEGMESEFADLMQSMQSNQSALSALSASSPVEVPRRSRRASRDTRCLIVAISALPDIKLMEAGGLYAQDFRSVIYLDAVAYNQLSGDYNSEQLGEAFALLEAPRGVVSKIRLLK